jgi:hypothetical protein
MDPATLIPIADPLPIHRAWFDILLIVTFTVHILFMNALVGSAFIGLVRALKGNGQLAHDVGQKLPPLLALTINMGVAPLLFLQVNYGHFDYVSSVLMGGWWLAVIAALMVSYYGFYIYKFGYGAMTPVKRNVLFTVSLAGLLYTGFMLTNNTSLMLVPDEWTRYFTEDGGFLNLKDPTVYPRFLHFMVGAVAVGGLWIALLGEVRKVDEYVEVGMKWFTHVTLLNLGVGIWFLLSLPQHVLLGLMGGNLPATLTLVASLVAVAMVLVTGFKKQPKVTTIWVVTLVFFMACTRHWVRTLYIEPWYDMETIPVTNSYGSFFLFLGFLIVGGAIMGYMLKLYFKSRKGRA